MLFMSNADNTTRETKCLATLAQQVTGMNWGVPDK